MGEIIDGREVAKYFGKRIGVTAAGFAAAGIANVVDSGVAPGQRGAIEIIGAAGSLVGAFGSIAVLSSGLALGIGLMQVKDTQREQARRQRHLPRFAMPGVPLYHSLGSELMRRPIGPNAQRELTALANLELNLESRGPGSRYYLDAFYAQLNSAIDWAQGSLHGVLGDIHLSHENADIIGDVIDFTSFLDQAMPISEDDTITPETVKGEKHWFDYLQYSNRPVAVS